MGTRAGDIRIRDQSVAARYARAIAGFRRSKLDKAIAIMDVLIHEDTGDPTFTR